ncbi:PHB depolymerase family esterase [Thiomonas delicata]|nr:PHB depolymerase family esterase [Thiomonas delicata]
MLHGGNQSPEDFAAGTGMNARAGEQGFFVLYPSKLLHQGAIHAAFTTEQTPRFEGLTFLTSVSWHCPCERLGQFSTYFLKRDEHELQRARYLWHVQRPAEWRGRGCPA